MLTFAGNGVQSQYLTSLGFNGSQFSLRVLDNTGSVWETVQFNANQDMAMLRGELHGEEMIGTISIKKKDGPMTIYSISSNMPDTGAGTKIQKDKK